MALHMPPEERRERHQALLATIKKEDVHAWSKAFLSRLQRTKSGFAGTLPLDRKSQAGRSANAAKARKAYDALMTVTLRKPTSPEYKEFSDDVKDRAKLMYPNFTYGEEEVCKFLFLELGFFVQYFDIPSLLNQQGKILLLN